VTDETTTGGDAAGEQAYTNDAENAPTTPAAPRRRRRPAETAGDTTAENTAETTGPAKTAEAPTTPARAPRARRSRAAAPAEPAETTTSAEPAEPTAAEGAAEAPAEQPAPAKRRSRARAAAPSGEAAEKAPAEEATEEKASVEKPAAGKAPTTRRRPASSRTRTPKAAAPEAAADAEAAPEADAATPSVEVGVAPRLATTALLFQAPEPTAARPRRRRAEAPAGPPRPAEHEAETSAPAEEPEGEEAAQEPAAQEGETHEGHEGPRRRRRRGGRGRRGRSGERAAGDEQEAPADEAGATEAEATEGATTTDAAGEEGEAAEPGVPTETTETTETGEAGEPTEATEPGEGGSTSRRRRRRRRSRGGGESGAAGDGEATRSRSRADEVTALKGSTRLEAKRQRRREGRDAGRRRAVITEAEFLARRESVERTMVVREHAGRVQIAILEDGVLVEHYVSRASQQSQAPMAGNVYLGRVQNVLPSMEAAFVDIGKGRNAVLYAGEVNWDAAGLEGQPRRIEQALKSGDPVLVQVTKEPVGHKGARLTSQITLAGRYLVYVPGGGMTGISRKLPENERARLKKILREIVPDDAGVIVRTAAEGASDDELRRDVERLQEQWAAIQKKAATASPPALLQGEPDLAIRVVRDVFNDDFGALVVQGEDAWATISDYVATMAPDLVGKLQRWSEPTDVFAAHRIEEQLAKGMERKVWLPSGGSLVIDRTEAMTVIDVNTGKFTGSGGTLEETVTRNNLEAAEEIVRQLRLRDIGGIIVIDFIDMVLESNRDLVLRRLVECLGRDRTKHQVAEVTSLGLVQMTRKRVGQGLLEAFSEQCPHCGGRGYLIHSEPVTRNGDAAAVEAEPKKARRKRASGAAAAGAVPVVPVLPEAREAVKATLATIAAAAAHAHEQAAHHEPEGEEGAEGTASSAEPAEAEAEQAEAPAAEPVEAPAAEPAHAEAPAAEPAHAEAAAPPVIELPAAETPAPASSGVPDVDLLDAIASITASEPAADDEPPTS
jgi:ribonuclease E